MAGVWYDDNLLPTVVDALEGKHPLKHIELHVEIRDDETNGCSVDLCGDNHIHLRISLSAYYGVALRGLFHAYALAMALDGESDPHSVKGTDLISRVLSNLRRFGSFDFESPTQHQLDHTIEQISHIRDRQVGEQTYGMFGFKPKGEA